MSINDLVKTFVEVAKELRSDYVQAWLEEKVSDNDLALTLFHEKRHRNSTYKRLAEIQKEKSVNHE